MQYYFVTHSQNFHLDDVFAFALLDIFIFKGASKIIRTRDEKIIKEMKEKENAFVVDVGLEYNPDKLLFDHHQNDPKLSGLSSCGLVWKYLKDKKYLNQKMNNETAELIEKRLIDIVDAIDNGININGADKLEFISMYNRKSTGNESQDKKQLNQFIRAASAAKEYYINLFSNIRSEIKEEKLALKYYEKSKDIDGIIVTETRIADVSRFFNKYKDKQLIVMPHSKGSWIIRSLNVGNTSNAYSRSNTAKSLRCPAPSEWVGLSGAELTKATGFNGIEMVFCHKNKHLTIMKGSLDEAVLVAKYIINNKNGE